MSLLDRDHVLEIISRIPHERHRTIFGEIYIFKLTDFARAIFGNVDPGQLKALSRMIAAELRKMGAIITRQHDHRRVMLIYRERATSTHKRKRRITRMRVNTR